MSGSSDLDGITVNRREALATGAVAAVAGFAAPGTALAQAAPRNPATGSPAAGSTLSLSTRINGSTVEIDIDPRASLLDLLRERLGLTGTKKGCDHGQCGACTVHLDGRRIASCLTLAAKAEGREVLTIEGISDQEGLHPMQQAFIDQDALQCGYCTPGQIMAGIACVQEGHAGSREQIREFMGGNICRCGAYVGIVAAIEQAAAQMRRS
jgi:xanthine dehydrogenase YagT iron-sulfur-binding subunit